MYRVDVAIVGAGFSGAVCAERLAAEGASVLVVEKRRHIGGNAYDYIDDHGVLVHKYGPHIFHTNSDEVFSYLSHFTDWVPYEHRVLACIQGILYPFPINRTTINMVYGLNLQTEADAEAFLRRVREERHPVLTSEDIVVNRVGADLCERFFRGYTQKQWGRDLKELSSQVAGRIPIRTNDDDRYFQDRHQAMPADGYTAMFRSMLANNDIHLMLGERWERVRPHVLCKHIVFTGPIDEYYGHCFGRLPYRSLRFEMEHVQNVEYAMPAATVNYPNEFEFTRVTEFKRITGQRARGTTLCREYPTAAGEPYYPVPGTESADLLAKYVALVERDRQSVTFVGRLAQYRYYNIDQAVAAACKAAVDVSHILARD